MFSRVGGMYGNASPKRGLDDDFAKPATELPSVKTYLPVCLLSFSRIIDLRSPSIARRFAIAFEFFSFHSAPLMTTQRHSLTVRPHQPNFPSAAPFWSSDAAL